MTEYLGDFATGSTVRRGFYTHDTTGALTALSSAGVTAYQLGTTVANTTGITLTSTFANITGLNTLQVDMVATSTFYQSGSQYMAVISSGEVGSGNSVAGYVLGQWSVGRGVAISTGVLVSTAVAVSTATAIDSVTQVNSTVDANVAQWRGAVPSTLGTNSHVRISTASNIASVAAVGSTVDATIVDISTAAAIQVNAEVVDALATDTYEEPSFGVPSSAASIADMTGYLYSGLKNQITVSSSAKVFYNDAGSVLFGKQLSQDSTGSTGVYTEAQATTST